MKSRSKIGNKKGNPAYRTPSVFRYAKDLTVARQRSNISQLTNRKFLQTDGKDEYKK